MDQYKIRSDRSGTHYDKQLVFLIGVIIAVLLLSSNHSIAGTYTWTDKNGQFHIVDDLSKVPPEYRKKNVEESGDSSTPSARISSQDVQEKFQAVNGSSDVSGSWIEKEDPYEFRDDSLVFQLEADGTGYSLGTRFLRTVKMSITWRKLNDGGIEIVGFRNMAKQEKTTAIYDRNLGEIKLSYGAKVMRRMKRSLPATSRGTRVTREAPWVGLWSTSETEYNSSSYFTFEHDGTGIMFSKSGYYYFVPFSWKKLPGGSIDLSFQVVSTDGTEAAAAQRGMKGRTVTMQYDDKADMLFLWDGKNGEGMFRIGDPLFRGARSTPEIMRNLEKRDGLIYIAKQGNASAALIVAQYYLYNTLESRPEGFNLLCRAAEAGNSEAQYMRGIMQYFGKNAPVNKKEGLKWIQMAANADHPAATSFLDRVEQREKSGNSAKTSRFMRHDSASAKPSQDVEIRQLIIDLRGPDPTVRQRSAVHLGALMATEAVEQLILATRDPHFPVQKAAIYALGLIGDPRSVPALIAAANNSQESLRSEALNALKKIGQLAVEPLGAAINDERGNYLGKQAMCLILGDIGDRRSVAPLIKALQTSEVAAHAAQALVAFGDVSAISPLIELLNRTGNKWAGGRNAAALALARFGGPAAINALISVLDDGNVSEYASIVLIRMSKNDPQAISALASTMRNKKVRPSIIYESGKVLINMGEAGKEQLISCSKDSSCEGRSSAEYILTNAKVFKEYF